MGCSIPCVAFEKFSSVLKWVVRTHCGQHCTAHYLDDFLFFAVPERSSHCPELVQLFHNICCEQGVPLVEGETEGPATKLAYLGIELNTVVQPFQLSADEQASLG